MSLSAVLLVGCGGFLGAIARYVMSVWVAERLGTSWPYGTFVINISGCLAIGFLVALAAEKAALGDNFRLLVPIGFIGAYTTFSTYALEAVQLVERGTWARALGYMVSSTVVGFAAVWLGSWVARRI